VIGASFYLMETVGGFCAGGALKGNYATNPEWRRAMGEAFVQPPRPWPAIDISAAGLADLSKPADWHARQVSRWREQLEGYATAMPAYNPAELPFFR